MRYIKTYEDSNSEPQVGDYVIVDSSKFDELKEFFDSEIGKISKVSETELKMGGGGYPYFVNFDKFIPISSFGTNNEKEMAYKKNELLVWSNNYDEIKMMVDAKKFNI